MKFAQPEKRVGNQKVAHLMTSIIENVSAPVRVLAFARIVMFIKRGAIESGERKRVFGKMRGHPSIITPTPAW
jgi:hypothetical protein